MKLHHSVTLAAAVAVAALGSTGTAASAAPAPTTSATSSTQTGTVEQEVQAGAVTFTVWRAENPSEDQLDAYARITDAMSRAADRYNRLSDIDKYINVYYEPGVPTADGNINGTIRFGGNRSFMNERTALHEISHTVGVGTSWSWACTDGTYTGANGNAQVKAFDGPNATLSCGGSHFWPSGLNYDNEWSETNADRHVEIVEAMKADGM